MKLTEAPAVGSRWKDERVATAYASGTRLETIKVMAVVDNWIMARRTGCIPFCTHVKEWGKLYAPAGRAALEGK